MASGESDDFIYQVLISEHFFFHLTVTVVLWKSKKLMFVVSLSVHSVDLPFQLRTSEGLSDRTNRQNTPILPFPRKQNLNLWALSFNVIKNVPKKSLFLAISNLFQLHPNDSMQHTTGGLMMTHNWAKPLSVAHNRHSRANGRANKMRSLVSPTPLHRIVISHSDESQW